MTVALFIGSDCPRKCRPKSLRDPRLQSPSPWSTSRFTARARRQSGRGRGRPGRNRVPAARYATRQIAAYPVVYALHGYSIGAEQWTQEIHVPQTIEGAFAQGAQEMIVVLPDSKTVAQRIDVLELRHHWRFRELHRARRGRLHRRALPHHRQAHEPRPGRPLHGRLRGHAHRHEALRCLRQPVHHEPLLPVGARAGPGGRRPRESGSGHEDARPIQPVCRSSRAPNLPVRPPGRPIRAIRPCTSICPRRTEFPGRRC